MASLSTLHYWDEPERSPERVAERATFVDSVSVDLYQNARILHELERPIYSVWDLVPYAEKQPRERRSRPFLASSSGSERVVNREDCRTKVRRTDFAPDGKYRAICKLFLQFRKYEYVATGWLIDSSTVVTAGHNVYDWRDGYLVSVKAFTGYYGPKSEYDPKVDRRHGRCVILPYAWIAKEYENYDVALIALEKPFTISTSVKYTNTPETETKRYLGVVGYPTDLDNGDSMYEGFVETTYDLSKYGMMLAYQVDTMGGNSGSPVLRMNDDGLTMTAIGVHCYGGNTLNRASVFGPYGNSIAHLHECIKKKMSGAFQSIRQTPEMARIPGFAIIEMPAPGPSDHVLDNKPNPLNLITRPNSDLPEKAPRPGDIVSEGKFPLPDVGIPFVFFIDFLPHSESDKKKQAVETLYQHVRTFRCWAYQLARLATRRVHEGVIPENTESTQDIAQALDWFFKSKAKCLTNHTVRSVTKDASVAVSQIHREILTAALTESFPSVEHKAIDRIIDLTKTIKTILGDKRQRPDELTAVNQRFWLMMTSYEHSNEEDGRTCAEIKIVSFHFTDSAVKTLAGKGGTEILNVRFGFNVDAFEFNNDRWMDVKDVIPGELVNKGHASINSANNSLEIQLANGDIS